MSLIGEALHILVHKVAAVTMNLFSSVRLNTDRIDP